MVARKRFPEDYPTPVEDENGCLIWQGGVNGYGYGVFGHYGRLAHRTLWEIEHGEINNSDMTIDHVYERGCRSKLCLNLDHMELVPRGENTRRRFEVLTQCVNGHPVKDRKWSEAQSRWICNACARARTAKHRKKMMNRA